MKAAVLEVPFADVRGDSLSWALGLPRRVALANRTILTRTGLEVELRVLGASHQVLVSRGGTILLSETVACDLPAAEALPADALRDGYAFASSVERLPAATLPTRVQRLRERLAEHPDALVATFPGRPHALTALRLDDDQDRVRWSTWHAYPQTGELVSTDSAFLATEGAR